jgi:hypothetical protein
MKKWIIVFKRRGREIAIEYNAETIEDVREYVKSILKHNKWETGKIYEHMFYTPDMTNGYEFEETIKA